MTVPYYNNYLDTTNFSDTTYPIALTTGSEVTMTVPGGPENQFQALFSWTCTSSVFVGYNATAAVPAANTAASVPNVEFKPWKRFVKGGDVLHFITSDATAYGGVSFRALGANQ